MGLHLVTLAERHGWNLLSTLAHPGYTRTNLQTSGASLGGGPKSATLLVRLLPSMDVVQGSEPLLHAIAEPDARQGIYYGPKWYLVGDTHEARIPAAAKMHDAARIWEIAERMTGVVTPRMAS